MFMHGEPIAARVWLMIWRAVVWFAVRPDGAAQAPASLSVTRPLDDPPAPVSAALLASLPAPLLLPLLPLVDEAPLEAPELDPDCDPELAPPDEAPLDPPFDAPFEPPPFELPELPLPPFDVDASSPGNESGNGLELLDEQAETQAEPRAAVTMHAGANRDRIMGAPDRRPCVRCACSATASIHGGTFRPRRSSPSGGPGNPFVAVATRETSHSDLREDVGCPN
jgi:hypothetical protein